MHYEVLNIIHNTFRCNLITAVQKYVFIKDSINHREGIQMGRVVL